jgi:hypothetical protein
MTSPHDRPTASELIESVREWLERDVAPAVDGRLAFHTRVAINSLDIVLRELAAGDEMQVRHAAALASLGVTSDSDLAARIRGGEFDADLGAVLAVLAPVIDDKVRVANPRHMI